MNRQFDFETGEILLFDKPYKWTSFDVVNKLRVFLKYYCHNPKIKVGHAGTLDPLATGLVIVCTGKMTKKIDDIQASYKEYEGAFVVGATRPSCDKETEIDKVFDYSNLTEEMIKNVSLNFVGEQQQYPPLYSAVKIDGVRAYVHARSKNNEVEAKIHSRLIDIKQFTIEKIDLPIIKFRVVCSKGTYIRSLSRDFGKALGCGAYLDELRRTAVGDYRVEDAYDIETFMDFVMKIDEEK